MTSLRKLPAAPWVARTAEKSPRRRGLPDPPSRLFVCGVVPSTTGIVCHRRRPPTSDADGPVKDESWRSPADEGGDLGFARLRARMEAPGFGKCSRAGPWSGAASPFSRCDPRHGRSLPPTPGSSVCRRRLVSADGSKTSVSSHRDSGRLLHCRPTVDGIKRNRRRRTAFAAHRGSRPARPSAAPCGPGRERRTDPLRPCRGATR